MSSIEIRLKQFKPTIKDLREAWHDPLFFEVLQVSYEVHDTHCTEETTCKSSRNFRKISTFSFKKASIQSKNGCCDANFWRDGPKEIGAKVAGKGFFISKDYA